MLDHKNKKECRM